MSASANSLGSRARRLASGRQAAIDNGQESFQDFRKRMRALKTDMSHSDFLLDEYEASIASGHMVRKETGIVYSDEMKLHKCEWDENYPEKPERYEAIMERWKELGLLDACKRLKFLPSTIKDLECIHSPKEAEMLKHLCENFDMTSAENVASKYDAIYFNKDTYKCAALAVGATLTLTRAIAKNSIQNGMAIVRPPGHHAQYSEFNGYCFFNNVAVAAKHLLRSGVKRILIVDFDVHHGQGTQQMFYNTKNVLYFSIHRYEHGKFWPNLRESNFDYIGTESGKGFNINVPLNTTGLTDTDYMAIVTHILLPVAYEFQPEFIIFSAGFDACIGCPEFNPQFILISSGFDSAVGDSKGEMKVSPGFYGHLVKLLSGLAIGKMAVILEGGYFLPSLAEGAAMVLQALLDCKPAYLPPMNKVHDEVISTINDLKFILHDYWQCFKMYKLYSCSDLLKDNYHKVVVKYLGQQDIAPFKTRNCYPVQDPEIINKNNQIVLDYKKEYGFPVRNKVCYGYDCDMLLHFSEISSAENPKRLEAVFKRFCELELDKRCDKIDPAINENGLNKMNLVHNTEYVKNFMGDNYLSTFDCNDMYWNKNGSKRAISKAVNTLLAIADAVMSGKYTSGVALIRPPGHHAEPSKCSGFCFINNIGVTARYLLEKYKMQRILIIDFDIHHGNGTQEIFYEEDRVLFLSIHKYEHGNFYPSSTEADSSKTGRGKGIGYNINVPFNGAKMDESDYLTTFFRVILPIAYNFAPEVILVSAGFDAGINDTLGNYNVLPEAFGHMIQLLKPLAQGRLILAMEGGYNLSTLKHSMGFCVKTLLGDPLPTLNKMKMIKSSAFFTLNDVIKIQKKYWQFLSVDKRLPNEILDGSDKSYSNGAVKHLTELLDTAPIV